jgi:hypothetical protein
VSPTPTPVSRMPGSPGEWTDERRQVRVVSGGPGGRPETGRRGIAGAWPVIGLQRAHIVAVDGLRVQLRDLEAVAGTPVIDVKPVLEPIGER